MMPVLLPGDAKSCQLPSNNSQNKTSRHSPRLELVDKQDIPFSWLMVPTSAASASAFMFTEGIWEANDSWPRKVVSWPDVLSPSTSGDVMPATIPAGRVLSFAEALELVQ